MPLLNEQQRQIGRDNYADALKISRRQMLAGTLAVPAAAGMYFGYDKLQGDPVKVAVIGTGDQGNNGHILPMNPDYCQLVAFSDIRETNVRRTKDNINAKFGPNNKVKHYENWQEMLDKHPDIEMVDIALPLHLHAPVTIECLKRGKHVLCEKLMAHNIRECKDMIKTADAQKRLLAIGHQRHYSYLYANCRSIIEQGVVLGDIRHIRAYWHRNQAGMGAPGAETGKYDSWFKPVPPEDAAAAKKYGYDSPEQLVRWRVYDKTGAGLVAELGSHQLDACSIFLGKVHPASVHGTGVTSFFTDNRQVQDHVFLIFEYPKESTAKGAVVLYSSINTNGYDGYGEQVMGTHGTMVVQEEREAYLFRETGGSNSKDIRVSWAEERLARPVLATGSTKAWGTGAETPDTLTSRGYREQQEHMAWLIRSKNFILPSGSEGPDAHPENDPAKAPFVPRCHGRVGMADAIIALVSNMAMKTEQKIKFKPEWFDPYNDAVPENDFKNV
jgi:predicted dehydrogenase